MPGVSRSYAKQRFLGKTGNISFSEHHCKIISLEYLLKIPFYLVDLLEWDARHFTQAGPDPLIPYAALRPYAPLNRTLVQP